MSRIDRYDVTRSIEDGQGRISLTLSKPLLDRLLQRAGVESAADLPHDILRIMCARLNDEYAQAMLDVAEAHPQVARARIVNDIGGAMLGSDELGYDLARRLAPVPSERQRELLDPMYSPVIVEVNVCAEPTYLGQEDLPSVCVLSTILKPPSLA